MQTYEEDFYKYGRNKKTPLLRLVFKKLPTLIGQTIKYANIDREHKAQSIRGTLEQLQYARIVNFIYHTSAEGLPLLAQINHKIFKCCLLDIGLLASALGLDDLNIIAEPDCLWINRGALAEQFIGQSLLNIEPLYKVPSLFYWTGESGRSSAEVDYVLQYKNKIYPLEVKAGKTGSLKSLQYFIKEKQWKTAIRFNGDTPSVVTTSTSLPDQSLINYKLLSLPFYLVNQLHRLITASVD